MIHKNRFRDRGEVVSVCLLYLCSQIYAIL